MPLSWSVVTSNTEATGDLVLKTKLQVAAVTGGYLLRAERELLYKNGLAVMPKTALAFVAAATPVTVSLSAESTQTNTTTAADGTAFTLTDITYLLTPLDLGGDPIGTTRPYLSTRLVRLTGDALTASHDLALAVMP